MTHMRFTDDRECVGKNVLLTLVKWERNHKRGCRGMVYTKCDMKKIRIERKKKQYVKTHKLELFASCYNFYELPRWKNNIKGIRYK